jgi:hypothetical protein
MDAPEQVDEPVTPVVDDAPEEEYDPYLERIEEAIAAVTGLPRRRPGQASGPAAVPQPAASVGMFDAAPKPELPAAFDPVELPSLEESEAVAAADTAPVPADVAADEPVGVPAAEHDVDVEHDEHAETDEADETLAEVVSPDFGADRHEPVEASEELAPEPIAVCADTSVADAAVAPEDDSEAVVAQADDHEVPVDEGPVRLQIRRPLSPAAAAESALEGDYVADSEITDDSTIFGQLRSNWLSDEVGESDGTARWSSDEVDRGWDAAERAENEDAEGTTRTGLPVRRPGGRLLPGGVSQEPAKVVRDPEAIRNRLAAHAAGVSRGRAAAAAEPNPLDYAHEETGPA